MKKYGILLLGWCMMLFASCSKAMDDETSVPESQPAEEAAKEMTGVFDVRWGHEGMHCDGSVEVDDKQFYIDLPAEMIMNWLRDAMDKSLAGHDGIKAQITESIGPIFVASSYKYNNTQQEMVYTQVGYSNEFNYAAFNRLTNAFTGLKTVIFVDYVDGGATLFITAPPAEAVTFSFGVEADGVPYRIDLYNPENNATAVFDRTSGLWTFNYWYQNFNIVNLKTAAQYQQVIQKATRDAEHGNMLQLQFKATKRTGPATGSAHLNS